MRLVRLDYGKRKRIFFVNNLPTLWASIFEDWKGQVWI
jgi:hypothetical protein